MKRTPPCFSSLVDSVTSEVGRALIGLSVLQLCVKALSPEQSIRLHKAGGGRNNFSWAEGVPMRVLDTNYVTPALREHDLLKLNADGFMMTRSLAENYPYSPVYKAAIRGARAEWLALVDGIESGAVPPEPALRHLLALLANRSDRFRKAATETVETVRECLPRVASLEDAIRFVQAFVDGASYSARLFKIAMHALFQCLADRKALGGFLKPLGQMRSANKKHGNVGDVEIIKKPGGLEILEAWDAKHGKPNLREELEELSEKLADHSETERAGFVVDVDPDLKPEISNRVAEIEQLHEVQVVLQRFDVWVKSQAARAADCPPADLAREWLLAFAESLCQMRRDRAPIDEPADVWVDALKAFAAAWS